MRRAIGTSFLVIGLVLLSAPLTWTSAGAEGGAAVSGDAPVVEADGVSGDDLAVRKPKKQTDPKPKATPTPKVTPTPTPEVTPTPTPEITPTPTPEVTPTPTPEITPTPTPTPTVTPTPPHEPPPPELPHTGVKTDIAAIGLTMLAVGVLFIWRSQERAIRLG